jgi:hypothetical protein
MKIKTSRSVIKSNKKQLTVYIDKDKDIDIDREESTVSDLPEVFQTIEPLKIVQEYNTTLATKLKPSQFWLTEGQTKNLDKLSGHPELKNLSDWKKYFELVSNSDFLINKKIPKTNFNWLIDPENTIKVLSGQYQETKENVVDDFDPESLPDLKHAGSSL